MQAEHAKSLRSNGLDGQNTVQPTGKKRQCGIIGFHAVMVSKDMPAGNVALCDVMDSNDNSNDRMLPLSLSFDKVIHFGS